MIIHDFKKLSKQEAEEKVKDILSFPEIETDPVTINSIGTTKEQYKQLPLVKLSNSKTKWELIRSAEKIREDTGYDSIYINLDLILEQWKLEFETRYELRELRQSNPLNLHRTKSARIVELPQQQDWLKMPLKTWL